VVKPLIELLSLNDRRVFWDQELSPGDQWDRVIRSAVKSSSVFVIFWCCDTKASTYVPEEISIALRLGKRIVPVRLCHAAMPRTLADWQWIDLQHRVQHQCADLDHTTASTDVLAPPLQSASSAKKWAIAFGMIVFLVAALGTLSWIHVGGLPKYGSSVSPVVSETVATASQHKIPLPNGYAIVVPPNAEQPAGVIVECDRRGYEIHAHPIPIGPPIAPVALSELDVPWWYANRTDLVWATTIGIALLLIGRSLWKSRIRAAETLSITKDYLEQLANGQA